MKNLMLILAAVVLVNFSSQAQNWWKSGITGEGPITKRQLDLASFDAVALTNSAKVYIRQGSKQSVEVEGQENILDNLILEVEDHVWKIAFDRPVRRYEGLKVYITLPSLRGARVSGSGDIIGESQFTDIEKLGVSISGSGNISLDVEARDVSSHISGSGNIRLTGKTGSHDIHISGSGGVAAYDLKSESCEVHISGSGDCDVDVNENLDVRISGSGDVNYKGRPRINSRISGSGDIRGKS